MLFKYKKQGGNFPLITFVLSLLVCWLILWVKVLFLPENADFFQKILTSAKLWGLGTKGYIFWNYVFVCLRTKFQVSSQFLTSFRLGYLVIWFIFFCRLFFHIVDWTDEKEKYAVLGASHLLLSSQTDFQLLFISTAAT